MLTIDKKINKLWFDRSVKLFFNPKDSNGNLNVQAIIALKHLFNYEIDINTPLKNIINIFFKKIHYSEKINYKFTFYIIKNNYLNNTDKNVLCTLLFCILINVIDAKQILFHVYYEYMLTIENEELIIKLPIEHENNSYNYFRHCSFDDNDNKNIYFIPKCIFASSTYYDIMYLRFYYMDINIVFSICFKDMNLSYIDIVEYNTKIILYTIIYTQKICRTMKNKIYNCLKNNLEIEKKTFMELYDEEINSLNLDDEILNDQAVKQYKNMLNKKKITLKYINGLNINKILIKNIITYDFHSVISTFK